MTIRLEAPVVLDERASRYPVPSLITDAVTPAFAALIASRMPATVLFVESTVTSTAVAEPTCIFNFWVATEERSATAVPSEPNLSE